MFHYRICWTAHLILLAAATSLWGRNNVPVAPGPVDGNRWAYTSPSGQTLTWLMYPQIQNELDLVTEQREAIEKIRNEMALKLREGYKGFQDIEPAQRQQ